LFKQTDRQKRTNRDTVMGHKFNNWSNSRTRLCEPYGWSKRSWK